MTPGTRIGPYEIVSAIGAGGMGEVYRATDSNLKRSVAIKVLPASVAGDAGRLARFQREAEVLAALNHPNIAAIYGLEKVHSTGSGQAELTALVMELVEGEDLSALIARGPIALPDALPIATQIADALEAAHEQGIIHRDLKPANIKVRADGTVKVLDFGLAKAMDPAGASGADAMNSPTITNRATQIGMILGTAAYMAPEQARGRAVDRRADIWAFGVVLYEMLSGRLAFVGDDTSITIANVLKEDLKWDALPPDLPAPIRRLLRRCLDKDPRKRLSAMGDARLDLDDAASGAADAAGVAAVTARPARAGTRALPWALAALATLAAVVLAVDRSQRSAPAPAVIRTAIPPPEHSTFDFDATVGPAALSPNGTMVVFSARSADGKVQLWLRPLDAADARPIAGTEDAQFPFWSPDSQSLGFYTEGKGRLERVDLIGGAPVTIARAVYVRGASWGADNTVLYDTPDNGGHIMEAPIIGGTPRVIATAARPHSPWVLPDGRHFLYVSGAAHAARRIHVASRDGTSDVELADTTSNAMYAGGRLLFMREDTLLAQPFDLSTLTLTGSPVAVARDVQQLLGGERGVFSASETGVLLYEDGAAEAVLRLAWFDRAGKRLAVVGDLGNARVLRLSPDGRAAAIVLSDAEGRDNVWTIDLVSHARNQITFARDVGEVAGAEVWAPDGRSIIYPVKRDGAFAIARRSTAGGSESTVFTLPPEQARLDGFRPSDWTADGARILYSGNSHVGGLWTLPLNAGPKGAGPATSFLKEDNAINPRLSPNQRWFAYQATPGDATVSGLFVAAFPDGGKRQQVTAHGILPVWGPDGKALYYASGAMLTVVDVSEVDGALHFGAPRVLMPAIVGRGFSFDVAKDGRILAFVTNELRAVRPLTLVQQWTRALKER